MLIVGFDGLAETIGAIFVKELRDDGDGLVSLGISSNFGDIDDNLSLEDFLLNAFVKVVRHRSDEHSLYEVGDLAGWYQAIELCGDQGGLIVAVDGYRLSLL